MNLIKSLAKQHSILSFCVAHFYWYEILQLIGIANLVGTMGYG